MRKSGILLPVSALSSDYGIGCFSKSAYDFVDWLKRAGQTYWQILPLGPTGFGDSPYQSFSTFAGNPYFISLEELTEEELLSEEECRNADLNNQNGTVDYKAQYERRLPLLKKAFKRAEVKNDKNYNEFIKNNSFWLEEYALFMAIKNYYGGKSLLHWEKEILIKEPKEIELLKEKLKEDIEQEKFIQYKFYTQWYRLKNYANKQGIKIIGDMPIYVSYDSADVWVNPQLFDLDENLLPQSVAGCPPDGFSPKGQLWGNPVYNWDAHRKDDFKWWKQRLKFAFELYDVLRIDHFRGFDEFYAVKHGKTDATDGKWLKGPGLSLFKSVEKALGKKNIIAEDLGFITPSVKMLLEECGYPGMKILQFAFDTRDTGDSNSYLPHNYSHNSVAYTGTHDNQTLLSWFKSLSTSEKQKVREYLCDFDTPDCNLNIPLIGLIMRSCANLTVIPIQDWLKLGDEARTNTPSTVGNNWKWRLKKGQTDESIADKIQSMTYLFGRC